MATTAQNAAVGAEAGLAVQHSSTALELVALTVADEETCDGGFVDLPVTFSHPHTTEGGGVQLSAMGDTGPAVLAPAPSDANQSEEQQQSDDANSCF